MKLSRVATSHIAALFLAACNTGGHDGGPQADPPVNNSPTWVDWSGSVNRELILDHDNESFKVSVSTRQLFTRDERLVVGLTVADDGGVYAQSTRIGQVTRATSTAGNPIMVLICSDGRRLDLRVSTNGSNSVYCIAPGITPPPAPTPTPTPPPPGGTPPSPPPGPAPSPTPSPVINVSLVTKGFYPSSQGYLGNEYRIYLRNDGNVTTACAVTSTYQFSYGGGIETETSTTSLYLSVGETDHVLFGKGDVTVGGLRFGVSIGTIINYSINCQRA